jgi:hypothetical protein
MLHRNMESHMDVLILVCALSVSAPDCQRGTSIASFYAPDPQESLVGCMHHGMLFASQTRLVQPGTYPKIVCIPPHRTMPPRRVASHAM